MGRAWFCSKSVCVDYFESISFLTQRAESVRADADTLLLHSGEMVRKRWKIGIRIPCVVGREFVCLFCRATKHSQANYTNQATLKNNSS